MTAPRSGTEAGSSVAAAPPPTRVSLAPRRAPLGPDAVTARPLLDQRGAAVILGSTQDGADLRADAGHALTTSIAPGADTLFGPRGACLIDARGPLVVADSGHHRLLIWKERPRRDGAAADLVLGQPSFEREGRNARGEVSATTLNVPTGVAFGHGVLAVADAWNHRVLLWHGLPTRSGQPADVVLGQADARGGHPNRGGDRPAADTLYWCYGVAFLHGRLVVADTGNRRVLIWDGVPQRSGEPAALVLGQRDFATRDENAGGADSAVGMRWPHGVVWWQERLFVADAGNNRVMVWRQWPRQHGAACDYVLGQGDLQQLDHNRGAYAPTAASLNMPYGLTVLRDRLVVADTASSRLVGFDAPAALAMGGVASALAGQPSFVDKGDNRWQPAARDSLCWPYSAAACDDTLVVADSGNNRVLLWEAAP
jgi:hypothetical protein